MKGQRRCSFVFLLLIWNWWMCFSTIAAQPPFGTLSTPTSSISAVPVTGTAYITQSARGSLLQKHCMLRASPDADVLSRWVVSDSLRTMDYIACQTPLSMDSPGKNTGVGGQFLLQWIFPTQRLNSHSLHCRWVLYCWATREAAKAKRGQYFKKKGVVMMGIE